MKKILNYLLLPTNMWRLGNQYNDIQHNDTQHKRLFETLSKTTLSIMKLSVKGLFETFGKNDAQHNNIKYNDNQVKGYICDTHHNDIQHNDTQYKALVCDT
jgi:hypothetical protein